MAKKGDFEVVNDDSSDVFQFEPVQRSITILKLCDQ